MDIGAKFCTSMKAIMLKWSPVSLRYFLIYRFVAYSDTVTYIKLPSVGFFCGLFLFNILTFSIINVCSKSKEYCLILKMNLCSNGDDKFSTKKKDELNP